MKRQHVIMGLALAVAAYLALFADHTPDGDEPAVAVAVPTRPAKSAATFLSGQPESPVAAKQKGVRVISIAALKDRDTLISVGHRDLAGKPSTTPITLFAMHSFAPPPPEKDKNAIPPPPPAPPLRFEFLGKQLEDGEWKVFLALADKTYVVAVQSTINNTYRVDSITPNSVTFTYLPLNQQQQLFIKGKD